MYRTPKIDDISHLEWQTHSTLNSGRWEDVQIAAGEIREAADHFTQLRAERSRIGALQSPLAPSEGEPGTVTVKVCSKFILELL